MKDKFGHLRDEGENKTKDEEVRGGEPSRDDQYSEKFDESQDEVLENIKEGSELSRVREVRRDTDLEDLEVGSTITDVDYAITYELDKNFDFHVQQNNQRIKVPVIWDKQERWTWARQRRNLKSIKDKVLLPLIVLDRTGMSEHPSHVTRPDLAQTNSVGKTFSVRQRYSKKNRYDQFTALQNAQPEREYYRADIPDFIQADYDVTIYTEYRWQMDKIVDLIQYYNYSYWGNEEEGRIYYTNIGSISEDIEMTDEARYVQTDISLTVDGYIVPHEKQDQPGIDKNSSPSKVKFSEEVQRDL